MELGPFEAAEAEQIEKIFEKHHVAYEIEIDEELKQSRLNDFNTLIPLNASCTKVESFDWLFCICSERLSTLLLTIKILMERRGSGLSAYHVSSVLILNMIGIMVRKRVRSVSPYMMAGPRYMRTRPTSSEIRFIKSPVLFLL